MDEEATVSLEFTGDEIARVLMSLTLARNSPQMIETCAVDDLIAKFAAHADETTVTAASDRSPDRWRRRQTARFASVLGTLHPIMDRRSRPLDTEPLQDRNSIRK